MQIPVHCVVTDRRRVEKSLIVPLNRMNPPVDARLSTWNGTTNGLSILVVTRGLADRPQELDQMMGHWRASPQTLLVLLDSIRVQYDGDDRVIRGRSEDEVLHRLYTTLTDSAGTSGRDPSDAPQQSPAAHTLHGRDEERTLLTGLLDDGTIDVIFLVGLGGQGKSALSQACLSRSWPEAALIDVADSPTLGVFVARIQRALGIGPDGDADSLISAREAVSARIVVENAEGLLQQNDFAPPYRRLIDSLCRASRARLLINARTTPLMARPSRGRLRTMSLDGVSAQAVGQILQDLGVFVDDETVESVHTWSGGNPLAVRLLAGKLTTGVLNAENVLSILTRTENDVDALVGSHLTDLSLDEAVSLTRLAWASHTTVLLEPGSANLIEWPALSTLESRHLVTHTEHGFGLHPMVREAVLRGAIQTLAAEIVGKNEPQLVANLLLADPRANTESRHWQVVQLSRVKAALTRAGLTGMARRTAALTKLLEKERTAPLESAFIASNVVALSRVLEVPLSSLPLSHMRLQYADFRELDLRNTDLSDCVLDECEFSDEFGPVTALLVANGTRRRLVVAGTFDGNLKWWDDSGRLMGSLMLATGWISGLGEIEHELIWATTTHGELYRIDLGSREWELICEVPNTQIRGADFKNGRILVACSDSRLYEIDMSDGSRKSLAHFDHRLKFVARGPQSLIAVGGDSSRVYIAAGIGVDGVPSFTEVEGLSGWGRCGLFLSDGRLVVADDDGAITLLAPTDSGGWAVRHRAIHGARIWSLAIDEQRGRVYSGANDGMIGVWSSDTLESIAQLRGHKSWVRALAVAPVTGEVVSGGEDQRVLCWEPRYLASLFERTGYSRRVFSAGFVVDPEGQSRLVMATSDHRLVLVRERDGVIHSVRAHADQVFAVHSSSGRVASGSDDGSIAVWTGDGHLLFRDDTAHRSWVGAVQLNPEGTLLMSGGDDRRTVLWDLTLGQLAWDAQLSTGRVSALRFLDPRTGLLASEDGTVRRFKLPRLTQVSEWAVGIGPLFALVAIDGDAVTGGATGILARQNDASIDLGTAIWSLDYSPSARLIAVGCDDGKLRLLSENGGISVVDVGLDRQIWSVAFDPSGTRLVLAGQDNRAVVYSLDGTVLQIEAPSLFTDLNLRGAVGLSLAQTNALRSLGALV